MKLKSETNINLFLDAVKKCEGPVFLVSPEGDQYNLTSTLTTVYIAMGKLLEEQGDNLELFAQNPADEQILLEFLYNNPDVLK